VAVFQVYLRVYKISGHRRRDELPPIFFPLHPCIVRHILQLVYILQVNAVNRDGETPVDILLRAILPADDEILDGHCCLYPASHCASAGGGSLDVVVDGEWTQLPRPLYQLLSAGAHGQLLERLVLHAMKESSLMLELCRLLVDLEKPAHYRLSGLLLQVSLTLSFDWT